MASGRRRIAARAPLPRTNSRPLRLSLAAADKVRHLVPLRNEDAGEAEFLRALGRCAGMDPPASSAMDFEYYLEGRLAGGERLLLLISGLGKCSDAGRERLADTLRRLS